MQNLFCIPSSLQTNKQTNKTHTTKKKKEKKKKKTFSEGQNPRNKY